ncbi:hypothetical protein [Mesorhizobium sp. SP-1A]|uniref:hypothetical protein n=1 Tax=Mesorhizobium sp. SP-1A TaxID=3077840 RepID=UPI0028F6E37B|nr:hypothetical protein [Mesorhizobium sp. SP-1A]
MNKNNNEIQPISEREQILLNALRQIMIDGNKQPENLHEAQVVRYSAGATKVATDALNEYMSHLEGQIAQAKAQICAEAEVARANGELQ